MKTDKNKTLRRNAEENDEFIKNEYRTNRVVAIFLLGMIIVGIVNVILVSYDSAENLVAVYHYIFMPVNLTILMVIAVSAGFRYKKPWIKYALLCGVIAVTTVSFFIFTTYAFFLVFVPIFISSRYFNNKITAGASAITAVLFLVSCYLGFYYEGRSAAVTSFHKIAEYNPWGRDNEIAIYIVAPCIIAMIFVSIIAVNMTTSGKRLLKSKIENTNIISAVNAEIDTAAGIQRSVLPKPCFETPDGNFSLCAFESPAKEVCGDFYDYFMLDNGILAVIVADVSDKGMPAAMFMMSAKKALQCALLSKSNISEAVELANKLICNDNRYGMFLTLWMGVIDVKSGVGKYINAGHPYPMLKHGDGGLEYIENEPDLFIGNFPDKNPTVHTFRMKKDDTLVIYTDGLTDATDDKGEFFGAQRVMECVERSGNDAKQITDGIVSALNDFTKGNTPFDDVTVLALNCKTDGKISSLCLSENVGIEGTAKIINAVQDELVKTNCPDDVRRNIGVTVDEALNNISEYAYTDKIGKMDFSADFYDNFIEMVFSDCGMKFNPLESEKKQTEELQIGGLGIYFIKNLANGISYEYKDGRNILTVSFVWKI